MDDGLLALKWNNHKKIFISSISSFRSKAQYSDATIACGDQFFSVHRIILSSCSEYFDEIFQKTECKSPVIILKDINPRDVEYLLQYMYLGEVEIRQTELSDLIKTAECLKIKGLATTNEENEMGEPRKRKMNDSDDILPSKHVKVEDSSPIAKQISKKSNNVNSSQFNDENINSVKEESIDDSLESFSKTEPMVVCEDGSEENNVSTSINDASCDNSMSNIIKNIAGPSGLKNEYWPPIDESAQNVENKTTEQDPEGLQNLMLQLLYGQLTLTKKKDDGGEKPSSVRNFDCPACGYMSTNVNEYRAHLRNHAGKKLFKCNHCDYRCGKRYAMEKHKRTHTGEKPHKCEFCEYRGNTREHLKRHLRRHTGEKPYSCEYCDHRCNRKENLRSHILSKHAESVLSLD